LNDTFEFGGKTYRISHLSEIGVRAERVIKNEKKKSLLSKGKNKVKKAPAAPQSLYWFGIAHFESDTGLKVAADCGFRVPIEPGRYVVTPEGPGEVSLVEKDKVKVRLLAVKSGRGRRKVLTCSPDQLLSLSQWHSQLSNAGAYIKDVESMVIPYSKEVETQASVELVQDIQDGKWRSGVRYQFPNTHGGFYSPSKFYSKIFDTRPDAITAAVRMLKRFMKDELHRADTTSEQSKKISQAMRETDAWIRRHTQA
jgi:hypothetical protein